MCEMPKTTRGRVQIVYSSLTRDSEFDLKAFSFFFNKKALCYTVLCQSQYQVQQSIFPNGLLRHLNSLTKLSNSLENVLTKSDLITECIYTGFIQYGAHFFKFWNEVYATLKKSTYIDINLAKSGWLRNTSACRKWAWHDSD